MAKQTNILSYNEARRSANSRRAFARYADNRFSATPAYPQRSSRMVKGSSADGRRNAYDALDFYADYDNRASQLFASDKPSRYRSATPRGYETDYSRMMDFRPASTRNLSLAGARQVDTRRDAFGGLTKSQVIQSKQRRSFDDFVDAPRASRGDMPRASRISDRGADYALPSFQRPAPAVPSYQRPVSARRDRIGFEAPMDQPSNARGYRGPQAFANETSVDFRSVSFNDQARSVSFEADEVAPEQIVAKDSLAERLKRKSEESRKARNKKKAEQALERHAAEQSSRSASADAEGPRAAVYEARMGASHKRAARMQDNAAKGLPSLPVKLPEVSVDGIVATLKRPPVFATAAVACCLALSIGCMYPVTRDYYQAVREQDRAALELEAVLDRNQSLQSQVDALQTSNGIKNQARDQLGWIELGEQIAVVEGMNANQSSANIKPRIMSEDIKPPETWYSSLLDPLFGVK